MFRNLTSNFPLKLISLAIAIVLWFIVLGSRNIEVPKDVPIEFITPSDLLVANDLPDKINFRLSGPKAFLRTILNRKEEPIRVNLSTAKAGIVTYRFFSDNIQLPIGVKVQSINPTAVIVKLEPIKKKEVAIKLVTKGELPAGFRLSSLNLLKTNIRIRGAESKVDLITELPTIALDLGTIKDSGEKEIALDINKSSGIFIEGDLPKVRFEVLQSSANFKIRNADIKVLTNRKFRIEPQEVTLYIRCSPEELQLLDRSKVFAIIDLKNKPAGTYEMPVNVQLPANIKLIKVSPTKAKITLQ